MTFGPESVIEESGRAEWRLVEGSCGASRNGNCWSSTAACSMGTNVPIILDLWTLPPRCPQASVPIRRFPECDM
jgi:hypothetical protein